MKKLFYKHISSPVGKLRLVATDQALVQLSFGADGLRSAVRAERHPILNRAERQLKEYFAGKRKKFELELATEGTEFQKKVWSALRRIPYGQTKSYGDVAHSIGQPKASRAVGGANNRNPIAIIVPCHRVIGANGDLTGFGGGLSIKEKLLALESAATTPPDRPLTLQQQPRQAHPAHGH